MPRRVQVRRVDAHIRNRADAYQRREDEPIFDPKPFHFHESDTDSKSHEYGPDDGKTNTCRGDLPRVEECVEPHHSGEFLCWNGLKTKLSEADFMAIVAARNLLSSSDSLILNGSCEQPDRWMLSGWRAVGSARMQYRYCCQLVDALRFVKDVPRR